MGFDIECIVDIHAYPGEYFCPVCRTLVYPNEAFQSQCSHLYCKPCLAHIANGSEACPYDGYLVKESDFKALMVSVYQIEHWRKILAKLRCTVSTSEVDARGRVVCLIALLIFLSVHLESCPHMQQMWNPKLCIGKYLIMR